MGFIKLEGQEWIVRKIKEDAGAFKSCSLGEVSVA